jgi:hypothetical protein
LGSKNKIRRLRFAYLFYKKIRRLVVSGAEITELSSLITQNRVVVLRPYFNMNRNEKTDLEIVHEVAKVYLEVHQTVRFGRAKANAISVPQSAVLLRSPLALLKIPSSHEEYLKAIGAKTRNTIRKADKQGYEFREFDWNSHLEEIFEINTSKEVRAAGPMYGWYLESVKPRHHDESERRYRKYYGVFQDGRLRGYLHLILCGDFAFFKHFLGHGDHLRNGIMNGLISWTVREYLGHSQIKWLSYGTLSNKSEGSSAESFRKHAGFESYAAFLDLENDKELLKQSLNVRGIGFRHLNI